jgi:AcrR family transcriptional regulator
MELKRTDRRVIRTKRAIRTSFIRLLAEKDLEKITIKEIADGADVDRKTVYNYYNGVSQILDDIENDLMLTFEEMLSSIDVHSVNSYVLFDAIIVLIKENMELYSLLTRLDGRSRLLGKIVAYVKEKILWILEWAGDLPHSKVAIAAEFVTTGMFAAFRYWFNSDRSQPIEEFTYDVARMVLEGLPAYFYEE